MQRKRLNAWIAVAVLALVVSACGDATKTEEYQTLLADRDAISEELENAAAELENSATELESVTEELAGATESLQASEAEANSVRGNLAASQSQTASLEAALDETRGAIEAAGAAADASAFRSLWINQAFYDDVVEVGVPVELGDQVLSMIGSRWFIWEEFADAPAAFEWGELVRAVDDGHTTSAWQRWFESEPFSDAELRNSIEVDLRIYLAMLERLDAALEATEGQ